MLQIATFHLRFPSRQCDVRLVGKVSTSIGNVGKIFRGRFSLLNVVAAPTTRSALPNTRLHISKAHVTQKRHELPHSNPQDSHTSHISRKELHYFEIKLRTLAQHLNHTLKWILFHQPRNQTTTITSVAETHSSTVSLQHERAPAHRTIVSVMALSLPH